MPRSRHEFEGTPLFFVPSSAAGLPVNELGRKKESIVAETPTTSTTLLGDIASGADNARWGEFFSRYEPMMKAYLQSRFPGLEADDIVQETLVALTKVLPQYHYNKEERGCFHNYLTGIVRRKALDALVKLQRQNEIKASLDGRAWVDDPADGRAGARHSLTLGLARSNREPRAERGGYPRTPDSSASGRARRPATADARPSAAEQEYKDWRESIYEIVLQELLTDETVHDQTKQIFVRTQINGEPAEKVMASLGVTRETIDHANSRCRTRLHDRIKKLRDL